MSSGNFSLTAAMCQAAALLAARHLPHGRSSTTRARPSPTSRAAPRASWPSGSARCAPELGHPIEDLHGPHEARGATLAGTQVHSLRLPSFVVSTEVVFGLPDERLTIRHDAGGSPEPYVAGTLIAARRAPELVGLTRGLDTLLLG